MQNNSPNSPRDRRSFLKSTSLLATAAWTGRQAFAPDGAFAAAQPDYSMQFGLVTYLWGQHMDLPTLLQSCKEAGVLGVEVRTEHKHGVEPSLSAPQRADVRKRFQDSGITLVGYGSNAEFHANDPAVVRKNIDLTKSYVQLMHDCGGSGVKVKPNSFVNGVPREKTIEQIGKALNEVAEYGEGYGQQIRVEVHGKGTSELPVIRDIFKVANHRNVAVCWNSNGEDLAGDGLEANFAMVKDRLGYTTHVRELDDKDYPYARLFKLMTAAKYQGWILLEARTDPKDKVAAMIAQRKIFESLLATA
jgi:sugar phosphate isomerase/epimerase